MKSKRTFADRNLAAIGALLSLLVGCGGAGSGEGGSEPITPVGDGTAAAPFADPVVDRLSPQAWQTWLAAGVSWNDRDGDGIPDTADPSPDDPPVTAGADAAYALEITRAWTDVDGNTVEDSAVEGYPLSLQVKNVPDDGTPLWVVFRTGDGLRASKASWTIDGAVSADPFPGITGVHLVAGGVRGPGRTLGAVGSGEPLLFTPPGRLSAGSPAVLAGRQLDAVESVLFGGRELDVIATSADRLTVDLPASAAGNLLVAKTADTFTNAVRLDVRQDVVLRVSSQLALAQGDELRFWAGGRERRLSHGSPVSLSMPISEPLVMSFDLLRGDTVRSYDAFLAVVWPGEAAAEVTAESSLIGRMLNFRQHLPDADGSDWLAVRAALGRVLSTQVAQEYAVALGEHAAGRAGPPAEELVSNATLAYLELARAADSANKTSSKVYAAPTTSNSAPLDGAVVSAIVAVDNTLTRKDDPAYDPQGETVYPEGEQVFGSDFALISVMRHEDTRIITPTFQLNEGCQFSPDEQVWGNSAKVRPDPYRKLWPADLCLQVDGSTFVSAAVIKPGFADPSQLLQKVADGQTVPQLLHRHSGARFADYEHQFGRGGYYLHSESGEPLCHMETCYIELVTSGYGAELTVPLTTEQQELVNTLRVRMWVEGLLPWMFRLPGFKTIFDDPDPEGGNIDVSDETKKRVIKCLRDDLLKNDNLYSAFEQLETWVKRIRDKRDTALLLELYDAIDQTIGPWLSDYVENKIGDVYLKCFENLKPADEIQNAVRNKILAVTGLSKFADVLALVTDIGTAVFTPEKFVFKVQPRAEIKAVSPRAIDLKDDSRSLVIDGDWLYRSDDTASAPCNGNNYCPSLAFVETVDGVTRSREYPLGPEHIEVVNNCGYACTRLSVPYSELLADSNNSLQDLLGGQVRVELAIADPDFKDIYPGDKLRIPVPGQTLRLTTQPKLFGIQPPLAKPGDVVTIFGTGFEAYGPDASFVLVDQVNQGPAPPIAMPRLEDTRDRDSKVRLRVPAVIGSNYRIVVRPGGNAPDPGIEPLLSQTQLLVATGSFPLVIVGDQGVDKDDRMLISVLDENNIVVVELAENPINNSNLEWQVPDFSGNYVEGRSWDESTDESDDLLYLSAQPAKVRVECLDGGVDRYCTFAIRSLKDLLCRSPNTAPGPAWPAQVRENANPPHRDYYFLPDIPGAVCADVFP